MPVDIHRSLSGPDVRDQFYVSNEPEELYDLENDPLEEINVIYDERHAEIAEELRNKVTNWMKSTNDPLLNGPIPGIESAKWAEEARKGTTYKGRK